MDPAAVIHTPKPVTLPLPASQTTELPRGGAFKAFMVFWVIRLLSMDTVSAVCPSKTYIKTPATTIYDNR